MNYSDSNVSQEAPEPFRVDLHSHILPKNLPDFATRYGYAGFASIDHSEPGTARLFINNKFIKNLNPVFWDAGLRIEDMDRDGINVQVLSPFPCFYNYWAKADDTADMCRILNNYMFQVTVNHPKRFVALATLPMQAPELAIKEMERCVKELNFAGVVISTTINDWTLDSVELVPFWQAVDNLNCCVYVHGPDLMNFGSRFNNPSYNSTRNERKFDMPEIVGVLNETTKAVTRCVLGGLFERFPKIRVCFAHGGGSYAFMQGRIQQAYVARESCRASCDIEPNQFLSGEISLKTTNSIKSDANFQEKPAQFWCDSVVGSNLSLELLVKVFGKERVLFGVGYPYDLGETTGIVKGVYPGKILDESNLSQEVKECIVGKNTMTFLGRNVDDFL